MYNFRDPDDPKYRIVVKSPQECILTVEHSCGHTCRYSFRNSVEAGDLVDYYLNEDCHACGVALSTINDVEDTEADLD